MLSYEEVKELARQKGYSLRELADKTGYEFSGFYKALNRNSLKYEARTVLAEMLGISMEELQGEVTIEQRSLSFFSSKLSDSPFASLKKTLSSELSEKVY
jgi:lambda repressor-like predicted transcriptional regulator